jgi:HEPN domain-containing protein
MSEQGSELEPNPFTAFEYLAYADQFYDAFYKLGADHLHPSISWPRYFLLCHAIELALKAYLAKLGATPEHLKYEFGHKLDELLTEAVEKGLHLTPETQQRIMALAEAHRKFWHRYPRDDGKIEVFTIEQFIPAAHELLNAVSMEVHGAPLEF